MRGCVTKTGVRASSARPAGPTISHRLRSPSLLVTVTACSPPRPPTRRGAARDRDRAGRADSTSRTRRARRARSARPRAARARRRRGIRRRACPAARASCGSAEQRSRCRRVRPGAATSATPRRCELSRRARADRRDGERRGKRAPLPDEPERLGGGVGTDENGKIELVEPVDQVVQRIGMRRRRGSR